MTIKSDINIIGRKAEQAALSRLGQLNQAAIIVIHGRRRVGKTTLIEHVFKDRAILKIEGVENGNPALIARILGFSAVQYDVGPFFSKTTPENFQIDLIFSRADKVLTICEIKYTKAPVSKNVIKEFERKMEHFTIPPRFSVQRVLISAEGAEPAVADAGYFDHIIDLRELAFSSPR